MKTLLLMRHAKSSWDDPDLTDAERPLNPRGKRAAPRMGRFLKERDLVPDHVVTSAAVRARTTAEIVAAECGRSDQMTATDELYHADVSEWQATLCSFPPEWSCVLCVGHNPGLEEFVGTLAGHYIKMPTAAIAHLTCDVSHWAEFVPSANVVVRAVWRPKELKRSE